MVSMLREILLSPFGSFASVFSLFIVAFWLVHWITKKVTEIRASHGTLSGAVTKIESNIEKMQEDIVYLRVNVEMIKDNIHPISQRKSPISLSELGQKISEQLEAEKMIAKSWAKIWANLEANIHDKNAYDIQQYIFETATVNLEAFLEKSDVDAVKLFAYKDGHPLAFYALVFGIPIRDRYLKQKGIDITDVDKSEPDSQILSS